MRDGEELIIINKISRNSEEACNGSLITSVALKRSLDLLAEFETQIRQDQKEKCVTALKSVDFVCETSNSEVAYLMEDIINAIMESE